MFQESPSLSPVTLAVFPVQVTGGEETAGLTCQNSIINDSMYAVLIDKLQ